MLRSEVNVVTSDLYFHGRTNNHDYEWP